MSGTAVILAGGLGTRLETLLGGVPKALADLAGKPFLERKIDECARNGLDSAFLLLGRGAEAIQSWLASTETPIPVATISDGPELLGTGGALVHALPLLPEGFFLTYGDTLLELAYRELELTELPEREMVSTLSVAKPIAGFDGQLNSAIDGGMVVKHRKNSLDPDLELLDYGLGYLIRSDIELLDLPEAPFDLSLIYSGLADSGRLRAHLTERRYLEIGNPVSLDNARKIFGGSTD